MPTRRPRQIVRLTPERAPLVDEVAIPEGRRSDLGGLVDEGAQARLERLRSSSASVAEARCRLADRVRQGSLGQDPEAADRVKRLRLDP
jgi:hypothetical protein